jgi:hypothetical protein
MKRLCQTPFSLMLSVLLLVPLLAACAAEDGAEHYATAEEQDLARRSAAMQRTIFEGAATGAVLGGAVGALWGRGDDFEERLRDAATGAAVGAAVGAAAGAYVGHLQQNYATREAQLTRLRSDIQRTNAETEAAIVSMRAVVAQHRRDLAAARAAGPAEAAAEEERARGNLRNMTQLIAGAEDRLEHFQSTRAIGLVGSGDGGVDAEVAELQSRIVAMRQVASTLAEEI